MFASTHCQLCPRRCGADRTKHAGRCGAGGPLRAARAGLHFLEEPCISCEKSSGKVFFTAPGKRPRLGSFVKVKIHECMDADLAGEWEGEEA